MVSKILIFLKKYHWIGFFLLTVSCLGFLLFQKGLWLYLDLSWWPKNNSENFQILKQIFNSWENFNVSYFGYDSFLKNVEKLIIHDYIFLLNYLFSSEVAQLLFYAIAFLIQYAFCGKIFKSLTVRNTRLLSLLYCFNPISIYLLSQAIIFIAYSFVPVFLYSFYKIINDSRIKYYLYNIIATFFLLGYLRIFGITVLFLVLTVFYYFFKFKKTLTLNWRRIITFVGFSLLIFNGLLIGLIQLYREKLNSQYSYVTYKTQFYANDFFQRVNSESLIDLASLNPITPNFSNYFSGLNEMISAILFFLIFYTVLKSNKEKMTKLKIYGLLGIVFCLSLLMIGKIINQSIFLFIFTKLLPFFAFNILWVKVLLLFFIITALCNQFNDSTRNELLSTLTIVMVIFSIVPLFDFENIKLAKIQNFDRFYPNHNFNRPFLFFPINNESSIHQTNYPYPLVKYYNSGYHPLVSDNTRLVSEKQVELSNYLSNPLNLGISPFLGLKDVIVFENVTHYVPNLFDFYPVKDYQRESDNVKSQLLSEKSYYLFDQDKNFSHFRHVYADSYDFFIYVTRSVYSGSISSFLGAKFPLYVRPLSLDKVAFQKPENIVPDSSLQDVKVSVKSSSLNATKHYVKFENVDTSKPFILQMNQTFGPSWKLKWVDEEYWNEKSCVTELKYYPITNNERCEYHSKLLEFEDVRLLGKQDVPERNHFEGNFIGNAWLVQPDDIPHQNRNSKTLHAVIIYEKQIYYMYSLLISGLTFVVLILLTIRQEWKLWRGRKNPVIIKVQS